jgi:hypothetical protein
MADAASRVVPYCRQTVYYHFRKWRIDGRLRRAHETCCEMRGARGGGTRIRDPSAAIVDSQVA